MSTILEIDKSSVVVMFSSEAETPTINATSASCAENDAGGDSCADMKEPL